MFKKLTLLTAIAIIATTNIKAQCSIINTGQQQNNYTLASFQSLGQSFTATCSGSLNTISLTEGIGVTNYYGNVRVYSGNGDGGTLLATQSFNVSVSNNIFTIPFSSTISLTSGNTYTFIVDIIDPIFSGSLFTTTDLYSGGNCYYTSNGGGANSLDHEDLIFDVEIGSSCISTSSTTNAAICAGGNYSWNSTSYNAAGSYDKHFTNATGCDSTATLVLSEMTNAKQFGNALNFNGSNNYVSITNGYAATDNITYETWVNANNFNGFNVLLAHQGWDYGYIHFQFNGGVLHFDVNGIGDMGTNFSFNTNTWYHVAVTYSKSQGLMKFYVNGNLTDNYNINGGPSIAGGIAKTMGAWSIDRFFNGSIDEFRVWNVVRTQAQIQASMNTSLQGNEAGLVEYYNFNQGVSGGNNTAISTLTDATSYHNNGTLVGFDLTGSASNFINNNILNITGLSQVCNGSTITLSNNLGLVGGVWSTLHACVSINATTGVVMGKGNLAQNATIQYKYAQGGCNVTATKVVTSNTKPAAPSISYAAGTANPQYGVGGTFCAGKIFTLKGLPTGGVWSSTGGMTVDATSGLVTLGASAAPIAVTYTVTTNLGCSNSKTMSGAVTVCSHRGVDNGQWSMDNSQWTMYPNPARSSINLNIKALVGAGSIVVTDLFGKQVRMQTLSMGSNTIDVSPLKKGFYLVSIITSEGKSTKKLIVE